MAYEVSLIIPTYNERDNVPLLVEELFRTVSSCGDIDLEIIIVDDNSPDGTGAVAEEMALKYPLRVIHRSGKLGLGSAVMEGFKASDRSIIGVMDADLSHDPVILPELIRSMKEYDIAIGSRFCEESRVDNWRIDRKITSLLGVFLARCLTNVADPLSGYFILRRSVLGPMSLTSPGYKILLEILVKGNYSRVKEVSFRFRTREHSVSKLDLREYCLFLRQLFVFYRMKFFGR